jgi:ABC-type Na+ efflux pump permease subunit
VYSGTNYVILSGTDKSLSAGDELRDYLENKYKEYLFEKYGEKAFPVLVSVEYLERKLKPSFEKPKSVGIKGGKEIEKIEKIEKKVERVGSKETPLTLPTGKSTKFRLEYSTPDKITSPSLLEKLIYSFFFVVPSFFVIQVFSSSLIEDKISRRIEVLIPAARSYEVILGKVFLYLVFSLLSVVIVSLIFGESVICLLFIFPIILFLMAVQCFTSIISRSYRELTFLSLSLSLLLTTYVFIPAIFSGTIPVSKISPITLMLSFFETSKINVREYVFSTFQFYSMAFILFHLSSKAMDSEILYSKSILNKIVLLNEKIIKRSSYVFAASISSIPFVFMVEFFLLSMLFILPQVYSIPILIASIALVEETFKASFVYAAYKNSANLYISALLSALGFFIGEKIIVMLNIATQYNFLFLSKFLVFPLLLHCLTMLVFASLLRFGFDRALAVSITIHYIYNYAMVVMLL